jgi:hypothetical protein
MIAPATCMCLDIQIIELTIYTSVTRESEKTCPRTPCTPPPPPHTHTQHSRMCTTQCTCITSGTSTKTFCGYRPLEQLTEAMALAHGSSVCACLSICYCVYTSKSIYIYRFERCGIICLPQWSTTWHFLRNTPHKRHNTVSGKFSWGPIFVAFVDKQLSAKYVRLYSVHV